MATAATAPTPVKVTAAPHTGITVRSLSTTLSFFRNALNLPIPRTYELHPPISSVTGHPDARIKAAHVQLPGGHLLELLEYTSPLEREVLKPRSADVGSWHLCLVVEDLDATLAVVGEYGYESLAPRQTIAAGPSEGTKVVYVRNVEDGLTLELWERPKS